MTPAAAAQGLEGGFADPARDAARVFRAAMQAMARPGQIVTVAGARPPAPLSVAAGVLLLTLADPTTPLHLAPSHDRPAVRAWIGFHCGAPLVAAGDAVFALGAWDALAPLDRFAIGTPDYPDRAATLVVEMPDLRAAGARLIGPGIAREVSLSLPDAGALAANHARFPLGWDLFLCAGDRLAALPRSTRVEGG